MPRQCHARPLSRVALAIALLAALVAGSGDAASHEEGGPLAELERADAAAEDRAGGAEGAAKEEVPEACKRFLPASRGSAEEHHRHAPKEARDGEAEEAAHHEGEGHHHGEGEGHHHGEAAHGEGEGHHGEGAGHHGEGEFLEHGEHGGHGGHGEHGEHFEHHPHPADTAIAGMLLGGVSFVMALFLLVNMKDDDMRYYAWYVISKTISIFASVLMFQMINMQMHETVLHGWPWYVHATGDFLMLVICFMTLQISVAYLSGAFEKKPFHSKVMKQGRDLSVKQQKTRRERKMRCWAELLSHMTGFASINFGGVMQQGSFFARHPPLTFIIVPLMYFGQLCLGRIARKTRRSLIERHHLDTGIPHCDIAAMSEMLTDQLDADHVGVAYALHKWDEIVYESENDIAGLVVSFLTVQASRFCISGNLPNNLGIEEEGFVHGLDCSIKLLVVTFCFAGLTMLAVRAYHTLPKDVEVGSLMSLLKRMVVVMQNAMAMAFAWGLLYTSKWEMARSFPALGNPNTIVSRVVLALALSFLCFIMIRLLDIAADDERTGDDVDMAIFSIINALSILVGFSWEQAFDGGVEVLAALTPYPLTFDCGLAVLIVLIVVTPWRRHILDKVMQLEEERFKKYESQHRESVIEENRHVLE